MHRTVRVVARSIAALCVVPALVSGPAGPAGADDATPIAVNTDVEANVTTTDGTLSYTFPVTGGEHLSVVTRSASWSGTGQAFLYLHEPDGTYWGAVSVSNDTPFTDVLTPEGTSGTWTATLDPERFNVGGAVFRIATDADGGPLSAGVVKTQVVSERGQRVVSTFAVPTAQHLTFDVRAATWSGTGKAYLYLYDPRGTYYARGDASTGAGFTDVLTTAETTGTWTAVLDPDGADVGSASFALMRDIAAGALKNGVWTRTAIGVHGQQAVHTFAAGRGQHLTFDVKGASWSGSGRAHLYLYDPDGTYYARVDASEGATYTDILTGAGVSGTWTAVLDPEAGNTGSVRIAVAKDVAAGALKKGRYRTARIAYQGQHSISTFHAGGGTAVTFQVKSSSWSGTGKAFMYLYQPDGTFYARVNVSRGRHGRTRVVTGPGSVGTWTAVVDPESTNVGRTTFRLV
jgi:hypothetical protein